MINSLKKIFLRMTRFSEFYDFHFLLVKIAYQVNFEPVPEVIGDVDHVLFDSAISRGDGNRIRQRYRRARRGC